MLGMYVHTHWSYNHPYAARTWTIADWTGYLGCLSALGYNTVLIWPMHDNMPVPLTPSDVAFLQKLATVIDIAHDRFGMKVLIASCANVFTTANAANFEIEKRYFWDTCSYVDPRNDAGLQQMLAARRTQWSYLAKVDGLAIIDSDPGGWPNSPSEDFVKLFSLLAGVMRQVNPQVGIYYWIWGGWPDNGLRQTYLDILGLLKEKLDFPWSVLSCGESHRFVTDQLRLTERRVYYPYGLVELEPSFPMINSNPARFRQEIQLYDPKLYPGGLLVNAQTHCLQVPYTYMAAHYARGGTVANDNVMTLGEEIVRGSGGNLANFAWRHMEEEWDFPVMRHYSRALREQIGKNHQPGPLAGLVMMSPDQFLLDLADNLDIRADMIELKTAVNTGHQVKKCLLQLVRRIKPYRDRVGYNHTFQGPLYKGLSDQIRRLEVPELMAALSFSGSPVTTKGYLVNLLDAVEEYASR